LFFLLECVSPFTVGIARAQSTSTPEERAKWVQITRKLEVNPLDKDALKDAEWALMRVIDVKDIHVTICGGVMKDLGANKYKYGGNLIQQYLLASAAFTVENPDKANDSAAANRAALESVLKAYGAIVRQIPKAKSESIDGLTKTLSDGKLSEYLQEKCK
jgi:hypothetical protein